MNSQRIIFIFATVTNVKFVEEICKYIMRVHRFHTLMMKIYHQRGKKSNKNENHLGVYIILVIILILVVLQKKFIITLTKICVSSELWDLLTDRQQWNNNNNYL